MKNSMDIIIIGAGSGGLNIAGFMNKVGFKVLLIDKSDGNIGGDCLNFGCVPSKSLIHIAKIIKSAHSSKDFGLTVGGQIDIKKVTDYIKAKKEIIRRHENAKYLRSLGIDVVLGEAKFISSNEVVVNGQVYRAPKIVIATGSRPKKIDVPGMEKVKIYTNENIFDIDFLPKNLLVVGSGPIGIELGQAFGYLGSKVNIISRVATILPKEDSEISALLYDKLKNDGINIHFNSNIEEFTSNQEVVIVNKKGQRKKLKSDAILVAIGRDLNNDNLDVEKAGIRMVNGIIKVDNHLRTTNKHVYVVGDVAGMHQFTHAAELHVSLILYNFFSPFKRKLNTDYLSWVTYTDPEIATFGLNESELKERNIKHSVLSESFVDDDRAIVENYNDYGRIKLLIGGNKILGGTMIAPSAGELIQELILANSSRLKIKNIFNKIYPYPTASRINKKVIIKHFSSKMSPTIKKILKLMY